MYIWSTMSVARIEAFNRGKMIGHAEAGTPPKRIVRFVRKTDGTRPKPRAEQKTIAKMKRDPAWQGQNAPGGPGRKYTTTKAHKKMLIRLVFKERGQLHQIGGDFSTSYTVQTPPRIRHCKLLHI